MRNPFLIFSIYPHFQAKLRELRDRARRVENAHRILEEMRDGSY